MIINQHQHQNFSYVQPTKAPKSLFCLRVNAKRNGIFYLLLTTFWRIINCHKTHMQCFFYCKIVVLLITSIIVLLLRIIILYNQMIIAETFSFYSNNYYYRYMTMISYNIIYFISIFGYLGYLVRCPMLHVHAEIIFALILFHLARRFRKTKPSLNVMISWL